MTIREIARLTGLSTTTICKALRNPNSVRKSTWEQIAQIQGEGKKLGLSQVHIILPDLKNSFFSDLLEGCLNILSPQGFDPKIYLSQDDIHKEASFFSKIPNRTTEGIVWVPSSCGSSFHPPHQRVILADRDISEDNSFHKVLLDNKNLAYQGVYYLKKFSENICFINGPQESSTARDRAEGAKEAAHELNIDIYIGYASFSEGAPAYDIACNFLSSHQKAAYLLGNQTIALGFLKAVKELKREVSAPCLTFDRFPYSDLLSPALSFIDLNACKIGEKSAQLLLQGFSNQNRQQVFTMQGNLYHRD